MRRTIFFLITILLIILSGCDDLASGRTDLNDSPVVLTTVAKGEILNPGDEIEIEYIFKETDTVPDKLEINITGPEGRVLRTLLVEEQPLAGWVSPIDLDMTTEEGLYTAIFDFYIGEDLFYSETREFFVASSISNIKSITSYPPVLYPGGGGLFHADIDSFGEDFWLRWTLDGEKIAEGSATEGYGSIEIEAPDSEGVYDLSLEVFPFAPVGEEGFEFESTVKKNIPLYVNTEQKSGVSEFGPADDFYALFHFRGSYYNSADSVHSSGLSDIKPVGQPQLAVRNGLFGYYLDTQSGFTVEDLMIPVSDGRLESFSVMTSVIPYSLNYDNQESGSTNIFYSGFDDGSFSVSCELLSNGRFLVTVSLGGESFSLVSEEPMLSENTYAALSFSIHPSEDELKIVCYLDGVPESEISYRNLAEGPASWMNISVEDKIGRSRIFGSGSFEGLVDEFGVYHDEQSSGPSIDPEQFRRAMELEYGKFLMYAEGFDGKAEDLIFSSSDVFIGESRLIIPSGSAVDFPPIYPGYEEVVFRIELADSETGKSEAVFYVDGDKSEIVTIDFSREIGYEDPILFSLVFSPESVGLEGTEFQDGETGFSGDFSGVGYSIRNNDSEKNLSIESILIIRKNINISEIKTDEFGELLNLGALSAGKNIRS